MARGRNFIAVAAVLVALGAAVPAGRTANFDELSLTYDPVRWESMSPGSGNRFRGNDMRKKDLKHGKQT